MSGNHVSWHNFEELGSFENNFYPVLFSFWQQIYVFGKHCLFKEVYGKIMYKLWSSHFNSLLKLGNIS